MAVGVRTPKRWKAGVSMAAVMVVAGLRGVHDYWWPRYCRPKVIWQAAAKLEPLTVRVNGAVPKVREVGLRLLTVEPLADREWRCFEINVCPRAQVMLWPPAVRMRGNRRGPPLGRSR